MTKLKAEQEIQKQTNRIINVQAGVYEKIGGSVDSLIRSIPGVGGLLGDILGTNELGTKMSESFRTSMAQTQDGGREAAAGCWNLQVPFFPMFSVKKVERDNFLASFSVYWSCWFNNSWGRIFSIATGLRDGIQSIRLQDRDLKINGGG